MAGICGGAQRQGVGGNARPVTVTVVGAAGQVGYALLPMIAAGDMFGYQQRVILQCLDLNQPAKKEALAATIAELEDGNYPLLLKATWHVDEKAAFKQADYAILLGSYPDQGQAPQEVLEKNLLIFRAMGSAIGRHAGPDCKVLVTGPPANTNAFICQLFANRPKQNFFALSRLDHNRAISQILTKAQQKERSKTLTCQDVKNVIIWGPCLSSSPDSPLYVDTDRCLVGGMQLRSTLLGKEEKQWFEGSGKDSIHEAVRKRGAGIVQMRSGSSAASAARAIVDHIHDLHCGSGPGEIVSMGVFTTGMEGYSGVEADLVFSLPVRCTGQGRWEVVKGLQVNSRVQGHISKATEQLKKDREEVQRYCSKHADADRGRFSK